MTIKLLTTILDLPTEILWVIADTLRGNEISALARTSRILYLKLRLVLIKYNIKHQNSSALHWAAKANRTDFAKTLLSYRANVNALVDDCSPLMTAVQYGSGSTFKLFLKNQKTEVNLRNKAGKSVLWYSVEKNSSAVVKRLLQHPDIEIDLLHCQRQTALWLAVFYESKELVAMLLSKGANPDAMDQDGISPWIEACIKNREPIKYLFLDHCRTVCPETKNETCTGNAEMIRDDANSKDPGALRMRLSWGEDVDAVDHQGRTALHLAAASGNLSAVKSLLDKKSIDCDVLDQRNGTPLHAAAMGGHLAVVDLLLRQNALVNCKDDSGNTPLWYSTSSHRDDVTERLLTENDVDVNTVGGGGRYGEPSTSLHHLARRMDTVVLRWFLARPTLDPNICAGFRSPLRLAITEGNIAVVRLLLTHNELEINARHTREDSPLCLATERGDVNVVKLLVEQGDRLKINQLNSIDEESALFVAVRNQSFDILDILLQNPAINLNLSNRWGETALGLAVKGGDVKIVKRLLQDSKRVSNLKVPALLARSRNSHAVKKLTEDEIERKRRDSCYPSQDRLFTRHVRFAYI
ncbi:hypothetical protein N7455_009151 [Penicillium solitum]|uniref:uncharacterized protein n=1 Tax=Penicillium solitum TaxID=60172 RepID=UPI0032C48ACB|nr:hypothetical protein N7455_009151 [Penicillium solitum]